MKSSQIQGHGIPDTKSFKVNFSFSESEYLFDCDIKQLWLLILIIMFMMDFMARNSAPEYNCVFRLTLSQLGDFKV